jgi:hypothetical protein
MSFRRGAAENPEATRRGVGFGVFLCGGLRLAGEFRGGVDFWERAGFVQELLAGHPGFDFVARKNELAWGGL